MELYEIRIDDTSPQQIIILREKDGNRVMPIVIGVFEAYAIQNKISGVPFPRPLTHDLLGNILEAVNVKVERIFINKLAKTVIGNQEHGTFFARIYLKMPDGNQVDVDSRPSDAIAVAVRVECPIYVDEEVLEQLESS